MTFFLKNVFFILFSTGKEGIDLIFFIDFALFRDFYLSSSVKYHFLYNEVSDNSIDLLSKEDSISSYHGPGLSLKGILQLPPKKSGIFSISMNFWISFNPLLLKIFIFDKVSLSSSNFATFHNILNILGAFTIKRAFKISGKKS